MFGKSKSAEKRQLDLRQSVRLLHSAGERHFDHRQNALCSSLIRNRNAVNDSSFVTGSMLVIIISASPLVGFRIKGFGLKPKRDCSEF